MKIGQIIKDNMHVLYFLEVPCSSSHVYQKQASLQTKKSNWFVLCGALFSLSLLIVPKYPYFCHLFVLRTLSTSDDVEDRETEKGRLEEAYEKCDRDLDELIVQHYTELTTAIRTYQSITERITNSRNKIKQVKSGCEVSLVENTSH